MKQLHEFFGLQQLGKLPQDVQLKKQDLEKIKNTDWKKISVNDPGEHTSGGIDFFSMNFSFKDSSLNYVLPGIVFTIEQDQRTGLNQPHIQILEKLRGNGIAYKLYRTVLEEYGHLVSKKSKRFSDKEITGLYDKLGKDYKIDLIVRNGNYLLLHKDSPDYEDVLTTFKNFY